ncbi:MAG: hypothetical protein HRU00_07085, partial [Myxococcales bacterium]|nr:hypothetical protein [Myxococcales bacterium]
MRHLRLRLAGIVGVWLAALLLQPAQALEFELPGERLVEIHGFYELRLRFFGEDLPANGATLSQFRHVLNLETEVDIMPEGWGPFDTMIAFTRWIASYETVYHKGIPPLAGANSYGGHYRTPSRNPKNYPTVETDPPFIAGVWRAPYQTGTVVSGVQSLGRAYRTCVNPDGVFGNPAPLSFLCNFYSRSLLGGPFGVNGDPPATGPTGIAGLTFAQPAGVINPLFTASLLSLARGSLGPEVVNDLFLRPRAGIRLATALAGREPGTSYCTGNPSIDPKGCSTAFTTPQDEGFAGQAFGTVRMLQAAGFQNKQGQVRAPQLGGGLDQARHLKWFPLLFDSDGGVLGRTQKVFTDPTDPDRVYRVAKQYSKLVGTKTVTVLEGSVTLDPTTPDGTLNDPMRSLGRKLTSRDLLASGQTLGQQVRRDGQLLFRLPTGAVTTNSSLAGAEPLFQPATIESEFGPAFRLFSTDPEAYEKVGALIYARLENDRFGDRGGLGNPDGHDGLAIINDSEITTSLWGATTFENSNPAVLTDLDAPIRPGGFLTVPTAEWISPSSGFLAHNLGTSVGVRRLSADGFCTAANVFNLHGVPYCGITGQEPIGFPDDIQFGNQLIAGPLGPDGIEFTADDLPRFNYVKNSDPLGTGAAAREGYCQLVQLTSNGDVRGTSCAPFGLFNTGA